jgi:hypothetical protein
MPCFREPVRNAGETFKFQLTGATNLLRASVLLVEVDRATGTTHDQKFTETQFRQGQIRGTLQAGRTYVLTVTAVPQDPTQEISIQTDVTFNGQAQNVTCKRKKTGVISTWVITVP